MTAGKARLSHPNVLKICGAGKSKLKKNGQEYGVELLFIVSELANNGEAFDYV